jgi:hypothetical protein
MLLILDAVRGIDSTGIAAVGKDAEVRVVKAVGNPYELLEHRMFKPTLNRANRVVIGHNRWATQGKVDRKNAHPFDFDNIVGAHNGTLKSRFKLLDHSMFQVDSENLFYHIEHLGLTDALDNMDGAWALTWWNREEESLNLLRNKERPLWVCYTKDEKQLFWASEKWMLEVSLGRAEIDVGKYEQLAEDMHYSVKVDHNGNLHKPVAKYAPCTYVPQYVKHQQQHKGFTRATGVVATETIGATKSSTTLTLVEKKSNEQMSSINTSNSYCQSRGVRLELVCLATDSNGAPYVDCLDMDNPNVDVRIYYKKGDVITSNIGQKVSADIKDIRVNHKEGTYYKVARETVKKLIVETINVIDVGEGENLYRNHRNKLFTKFEFESAYTCCDLCSGYVDPDQPYKFATNGEAICHTCVSDTELMKYVNVM